MDCKILIILASLAIISSAWSIPFHPAQRGPLRVVRYAPPRHYETPHDHRQHRIPLESAPEEPQQRPKRGHDDYSHGSDHRGSSGVTGPVHTFVKTDKNANYKWGVRHHVGDKYAS